MVATVQHEKVMLIMRILQFTYKSFNKIVDSF